MNTADRYISFPLQYIHPDHPVPGDVYIFLDNRFINYVKSLSILSQLKQEQLIVKGVNFLFIEIVLLAILCPELAAVTGNQFTSDQIKVFGNPDSFTEYLFDGFGYPFESWK